MSRTETNGPAPSEAEGKILYWIGTPRHFLIAAGMAVGDAALYDSHLLFTSAHDYVDGIKNVLDRWSGSPFSHTRVIRPPARGKIMLANRLRARRNAQRFRRMARELEHSYSEMRVFTATDLPTQAFLYEIKQISPATRRIMVEDGGIYYNSQPIGAATVGRYPEWKSIAARRLYGPAWSAVRENGIGEVIDEIQMIAPELARGELAAISRVELSPDHLRRLADTDLPSVYLSLYGCDANEMRSVDFAVILSRSDGLTDGMACYVETINKLIEIPQRRGLKTALKYHPKEKVADYMGLADKTGIMEIPREIPMELLYIVNSHNLRFVLGDASSALLGAPWILPDCKAVSFVNMVNKAPELIFSDFKGFGIESIDSFSDLERILEAA